MNKIKKGIGKMKYSECRSDLYIGKYIVSELLKLQSNKCSICHKEFEDRPKSIHIDHDHSTGEIRSLLCNKCNSMLGFAEDNIEILKNAISYLEKNPMKEILKEFQEKFILRKEQLKIECNEKRSLSVKNTCAKPEVKEKKSKATQKYFSDPKNREKRSKATIEYFSDPKNRQKISDGMRARTR
jgi:predicted RNA-binding protein with RPS1 domain